MEHEGDGDTNDDRCIRIPKGLVKELKDLKINEDHPDNNFIEVGQNTEKSAGDLRRLAGTQTLVKDH